MRPAPGVASRVASPPYDVLTVETARALTTGRPESFLRVTRAELELADDVDPHSDAVYMSARANFEQLLATGVLVREAAPSLYAYRLRCGAHTQMGVAGAFAVEDLERGVIKPHERTRRDKEDDRTRHIETVGAQTGPVFLTYRALDAAGAILERAARGSEPLCDFTAEDGVAHTVWRLADDGAKTLVRTFAEHVPALYIADGHHRAAAAARAASQWRDVHPATAPGDRADFLGVAFPHDQLQILAYHRTVRDLGGRTAVEFLRDLAARPAVRDLQPADAEPSAPSRIAMYTGGRWYAFRFGTTPNGDPVRGLDTQRLQEEILEPVLGIADPRTDPRIDFVGGIHGPDELQQRVDGGQAAVAFALHPLAIESLFQVADAGAFLPPKSTWFEPKLRDGLLVHAFADRLSAGR